MVNLPDPEVCRSCQCKGRVISKERGKTPAGVVYWRRRHECRNCIDPSTGKLRRWTSTQSLVDLRRIKLRAAVNPNL